MMAVRRGIKGVLVDLSGTLHVEDTPTPNAVAAVMKCVHCNTMLL